MSDHVQDGPSQDGTREKHVHYNDAPSTGSVSDDDTRRVEVSFDPLSPHRRKSSLVPGDRETSSNAKRRQQKPFLSDCIVHQFLEGHKRDARPEGHSRAHPNLAGHSASQERDVSGEIGLNEYVEPKGKSPSARSERLSFIEPESDDSTASGQFDEKSWKSAVTRSRSEVDLANQDEQHHSRLLTKKQLTDMAWGVRELSRRLGMVRLKFKAERIFLLTKAYDEELIPKTRALAKWLLSRERDTRYTVYIQDELKENRHYDLQGLTEELQKEYVEAGELDADTSREKISRRMRFWTEEMCRKRPHDFDLIITLGGDGTVLYASWLFQRIVPPVLSFALGSLGFLTKFDFNDYQQTLNTAFKEGISVSLRLRFEGTIMRSQERKKVADGEQDGEQDGAGAGSDGGSHKRDLVEELIGEEKDDNHTHKPEGTYEILNEIVVDRGPNPTLSYLEIFGDDEYFTSVLADGICVSTPTGSTAYNLAAGGSLCHPENPVMLVTAICAHTLSFRPIILPDTIVLRVGVPYDARTSSWASFDGRERIELRPGDYVTISASRFPFASVQPQGRRSEDWVNSISGKLGWNTRHKQKNEGFKKWDS
ncbi:ATP-NAD kinase [Xylariaceae sp. FL0594]|nr:ATP-NAD kinase [Xylariaceae sp. FL0594]